MIEFYQSKWFDIDLCNVDENLNIKKLPDHSFYYKFYSILLERHSSYEQVKQHVLSCNQPAIKYLTDVISSKGYKNILSIGSGIGFIEYELAKNNPHVNFYANDFNIESYFLLGAASLDNIKLSSTLMKNVNYDLIYLNNVDYALSNQHYDDLLQQIRGLSNNGIVLSTVVFKEDLKIYSIIKNIFLKYFDRKSIFWGYIRSKKEHNQIIKNAGYKINNKILKKHHNILIMSEELK